MDGYTRQRRADPYAYNLTTIKADQMETDGTFFVSLHYFNSFDIFVVLIFSFFFCLHRHVLGRDDESGGQTLLPCTHSKCHDE